MKFGCNANTSSPINTYVGTDLPSKAFGAGKFSDPLLAFDQVYFFSVHHHLKFCRSCQHPPITPWPKLPRNLFLLQLKELLLLLLLLLLLFIYLFKIDFYITFYNYKKPIGVNLPRNLEKNLDAKRFANSLI